MDIPHLIGHIGLVRKHSKDNPPRKGKFEKVPDFYMSTSSSDKFQEVLILLYLHSLGVYLEDVGDEKLMHYFGESDVVEGAS